MAKLKFLLLGLAVLYGIGAAPVHAGSVLPAPLKAVKAPKTAPPVAFYDAGGKRHALSEYKGRYVLMNFWATYCVPCVVELPALAKLKGMVPGVSVLAVDITGHQETAAMAQAFLKSHNAAVLEPMLDKDVTMMRSFVLYAIPTTVLIDPQGREVARATGPGEWAAPQMVAYLKGFGPR
jgi:thiol-disulfide isomerase/thioredoxin